MAASSGNLGIGLAAAGAARGYRVVIVIYEDTSYEHKVVVQNLGAELVLTPKEDGVRGSVEEAGESPTAHPAHSSSASSSISAAPRSAPASTRIRATPHSPVRSWWQSRDSR
ncbi:pyridoxal-phosphate dependent enzyme (plasmid) [Mycolicibacterium psychrotolerans]|uniref:pyridoxal-phosphate dependent enzyme n=1 Tax=Mycolicibacterium psychrotolerans TaxID=216929 RepID=UPI003D67EC2C